MSKSIGVSPLLGMIMFRFIWLILLLSIAIPSLAFSTSSSPAYSLSKTTGTCFTAGLTILRALIVEMVTFAAINDALGNDNTQIINCFSVGVNGCVNGVFDPVNFEPSNDNTQNMKCIIVSGGCLNNANGDSNDQNLLCVKSSQCTNESNTPTGGNTQKSVCVNSGTCQNDGIDTKVISVKSDNCQSDDASGSTTICVNNRIINRP